MQKRPPWLASLEMPFTNVCDRFLQELVEQGEVPVARIDDAALRLLHQQVRLGQGRNPADYDASQVGTAARRALAHERRRRRASSC